MPELPEVETVARTLLPHLAGCRITSAQLLRPSSLHPLSLPLNLLIGQGIESLRRRGKLLILDLSPAKRPAKTELPTMLVAHLRMTGRFLTQKANQEIGKHTRCIFGLQSPDNSPQQLFFDDTRAFGQLFAATPELLQKWPFWRDLGPEPLEMQPNDLAPRLKSPRPIKGALLDQKVIAGIGNIYADESLFKAGILPERKANSLSLEESASLLYAIQAILKKSISQCGSSIRDYRDANGNAGAFQNSFQVYGRGGQKCKSCGAILQKTRLGGRATVFCPECQK